MTAGRMRVLIESLPRRCRLSGDVIHVAHACESDESGTVKATSYSDNGIPSTERPRPDVCKGLRRAEAGSGFSW